MERNGKEGALFFALLFLILSVVLLAQVDDQTVWSARKSLTAQPRFWPIIGLIMMVGFGAVHLWRSRSSGWSGSGRELWIWARGLEFVAWFLGYVFLVPQIGYLLASVMVAVMLTLRVGFRGKRWVFQSTLLAVGIVVVFRVVLNVRLPAGEIYHLLPEPLSNFMLTWL